MKKRLWDSKQVHVPMHRDFYEKVKRKKGTRTYNQFWNDIFNDLEDL